MRMESPVTALSAHGDICIHLATPLIGGAISKLPLAGKIDGARVKELLQLAFP